MRKRSVLVLTLATLSAVVALALVALGGASGAVIRRYNLAAPTFRPIAKSVHNDGSATPVDACATAVTLDPGEENRGDLQNAKGSFLANADLPNGGTVSSLTLFANDNDGDIDSAAYLVRKRITDGLSPAKGGYAVMAQATSSGAVLDTLRAFTDATVQNAVVDNSKYQYYVELVNCGGTVEPFSVRIVSLT